MLLGIRAGFVNRIPFREIFPKRYIFARVHLALEKARGYL
jgi:hypothetical protein